jgi:hypothetical protein
MFGLNAMGSLAGKAMTSDGLPLSYPERVRQVLSGSLPSVRRTSAKSSASYLINVDFEARDGQVCFAVGGGTRLEDAVAAAREAVPPGPEWKMIRWNHLHGE